MSSLQGRTIVITRQPEQGRDLARLLEDRGARVLFCPVIRIVPPASWEHCDAALSRFEMFDAMAFTSENAVRFLFHRAQELGYELPIVPVYAIGEHTKAVLESFGIFPITFAGARTAKEFGAAIARLGCAGRRFLEPVGNLASGELSAVLRASGAAVEEVIVYETVKPEAADMAPCRYGLRTGIVDAVTFFSPSSVSNFFDLLGEELPAGCAACAIGPTTSAALQRFGVAAVVTAARPTTTAMVDALDQFFSTR